MRSWTAEGLDKGNMMSNFLDELDQLVSRWKASAPTCQQSSGAILETSSRQEGPSGGRLDVKQCSIKSPVCSDASRLSGQDVTACDCRSSVSNIRNSKTLLGRRAGETSSAVGFTLFSDSREVDRALMAELPADMRAATGIWVRIVDRAYTAPNHTLA